MPPGGRQSSNRSTQPQKHFIRASWYILVVGTLGHCNSFMLLTSRQFTFLTFVQGRRQHSQQQQQGKRKVSASRGPGWSQGSHDPPPPPPVMTPGSLPVIPPRPVQWVWLSQWNRIQALGLSFAIFHSRWVQRTAACMPCAGVFVHTWHAVLSSCSFCRTMLVSLMERSRVITYGGQELISALLSDLDNITSNSMLVQFMARVCVCVCVCT